MSFNLDNFDKETTKLKKTYERLFPIIDNLVNIKNKHYKRANHELLKKFRLENYTNLLQNDNYLTYNYRIVSRPNYTYKFKDILIQEAYLLRSKNKWISFEDEKTNYFYNFNIHRLFYLFADLDKNYFIEGKIVLLTELRKFEEEFENKEGYLYFDREYYKNNTSRCVTIEFDEGESLNLVFDLSEQLDIINKSIKLDNFDNIMRSFYHKYKYDW